MKKQAYYIKRIEIKRLWGRKDISYAHRIISNKRHERNKR